MADKNGFQVAFRQLALAGADPAAALDPTLLRLGTILFDQTDLVFYEVCADATTGVHVWRSMAGGGATTVLGKYFVAPDQGALGPRALYHDPAVAVAQAVTDLHDDANPADVIMFPSVYALSAPLALPPGIRLVNIAAERPDALTSVPGGLAVTIAGQITVTGPGTRGLVGVAVVGGAGQAAVVVTGDPADAITLRLDGCVLQGGTDASGLTWTGNTSGTLYGRSSSITGDGSANSLVMDAFAQFSECSILDAATADAITTSNFVDARFSVIGAVTLTGSGTLTVAYSSCGTVRPALATVAAGAIYQAEFCDLVGAALNGPGRITLVDTPLVNITKGATALTLPQFVLRLNVDTQVAAGSTLLPSGDIFLVPTAGGTVVFNLGLGSASWSGRKFGVKPIGVAGQVNVTPNVAQHIDGLANGVAWVVPTDATGKWPIQYFEWSEAQGCWISV